jgi:hypothetical protein
MTPAFRNRHSVPGLGRVDADERLTVSPHASSPVP